MIDIVKNNKGNSKTIPIIVGDYGAADPTDLEWSSRSVRFERAPLILVDVDTCECLQSCHKVHTLGTSSQYYILKYMESVDDHMKVINNDNTSVNVTNNYTQSIIEMQPDEEVLYGISILPLDKIDSYTTTITNKDNLVDLDYTTYAVLPHTSTRGRATLTLGKKLQESFLGKIYQLSFNFYANFADNNLNSIDYTTTVESGSVSINGAKALYTQQLSSAVGEDYSNVNNYQFELENNTTDDAIIENPQDFYWYHSYIKATVNILGVTYNSKRPKNTFWLTNKIWDTIDMINRGNL